MIGRHDQDLDSDSKSEDKEEEDPINLPSSSFGGGQNSWNRKKYKADFFNNKYTEGVTYINFRNKASPNTTEDQVDQHVMGVIFQQKYSFKAGLRKFEYEGDKAVNKEL